MMTLAQAAAEWAAAKNELTELGFPAADTDIRDWLYMSPDQRRYWHELRAARERGR
jgi:hypothetical protein